MPNRPSHNQTLLLFLKANPNKWFCNFQLYRELYGTAPSGRLGSVIHRLQRHGAIIKAMTDGDYIRQVDDLDAPVDPARYWYRYEGMAAPQPGRRSIRLAHLNAIAEAAAKVDSFWKKEGRVLWTEEQALRDALRRLKELS